MFALSPVCRLAVHTIVGTILFAVMGGAAVLLQHAPVFIEYSGVLPATILMLHGVEFMLFASGAAGLVVFILHEIHLFLRGIFRPGGSHDPSYEIKGSCIGPVPATYNVNPKIPVEEANNARSCGRISPRSTCKQS